jgi:hypothetical protein
MERTKTLLSCLTDKCFPPASSLPPPACFVYNIEVHGECVYQVGKLGLVVHNTRPGDFLQTGDRTILKSTARTLNDFLEVSLHSREWGRSLEKLKKFEGLRSDHHGIINRAGDYLDDAGNFIGNLADYP